MRSLTCLEMFSYLSLTRDVSESWSCCGCLASIFPLFWRRVSSSFMWVLRSCECQGFVFMILHSRTSKFKFSHYWECWYRLGSSKAQDLCSALHTCHGSPARALRDMGLSSRGLAYSGNQISSSSRPALLLFSSLFLHMKGNYRMLITLFGIFNSLFWFLWVYLPAKLISSRFAKY